MVVTLEEMVQMLHNIMQAVALGLGEMVMRELLVQHLEMVELDIKNQLLLLF